MFGCCYCHNDTLKLPLYTLTRISWPYQAITWVSCKNVTCKPLIPCPSAWLVCIPIPDHDWTRTIYGNVKELVPMDAPWPLGEDIILTIVVDAKLWFYHRSLCDRNIALTNQTLIELFSKKQPLFRTATYGSEYMATEKIIELWTNLLDLALPIKSASYLFGDNTTVLDSNLKPDSKLNKLHVHLHRVRELIAAQVLHFIFILGLINPADILGKACGYQAIWLMLKALLFWEDTELIE